MIFINTYFISFVLENDDFREKYLVAKMSLN